MLHPGMASELARLESEERRRWAAGSRTTGSSDPEWRWSAAGAVGLLALVLIGPIATVLAFAGLVAVAVFVSADRRGQAALGPDPRDRWSAWRAVEADAEEQRQRAA